MANPIAMPIHHQFQDLTGHTYGRLEVINYAGKISKHNAWHCKCECGTTAIVLGSKLRSGHTKSCGCYQKQRTSESHLIHGHCRSDELCTSEYSTYYGMLRRCNNSDDKRFDRYGGRGIKVCDRWQFGEDGNSAFECFLADMGLKPSPIHSIERKDNDGNYEPQNCIWGTKEQQHFNRSVTYFVDWEGEKIALKLLCNKYQMPYNQVWLRIKRLGWDIPRAILTPMRKQARNGRS